ncbi:MAG: hypothetical protein ACRDHW_04785 [Ktedonobacteraceae bacterium]
MYHSPNNEPARPRHGALYWTLFILFFPVTIPYVLLRWSILSIRNAPPRPARKPHPHKKGPSLATRMNRLARGMGRVNRTVAHVRAADRRNRRSLGTRK